ncbi:MAG: aminotransferase class V-fold PLP-dependent enzyme [Planctomycetes bacterium]|nr:aminotransferase class V-fold PLP-dependent enzyme [Planctomycetota bacterium]
MNKPSEASRDPSTYARLWALDERIAMLNHGSFGACPRAVLEAQRRFRDQMEAEPVRFFARELQPLLDASRETLAELVGARADDLVFVRSATAAVNSVLRSLPLAPGDELLLTDHGYNACGNVAEFVAGRAGAKVVVAPIRLPLESAEQVVDAVMRHATERTRLAMIDHVTSPTAMVFPIERIVRALADRGIDVLVDGAHAPAMVPLDVSRIGAAYYTGNCHKWLCAPKGAAFLHVRDDRQAGIQPTVISHGYNTPRPGRSAFQDAFDWTGTDDPSPWLCVPEAIRFLRTLGKDGGIETVMQRNRQLALAGRRILCDRLPLEPVCADDMIGSMVAIRLPDDPNPRFDPATSPNAVLQIHSDLLHRFAIEVPVYPWPAPPGRLLRISAQAYNTAGQYEQLADALGVLLA